MKKTSKTVKVALVLLFALILGITTACGSDNPGDDATEKVETTPIPSEMCEEVNVREAKTNAEHTSSVKAAKRAYHLSVAKEVEDGKDVDAAEQSAQKAYDKAVKTANETRDAALKALQADKDVCATLLATPATQPSGTGTDESSDSEGAAPAVASSNVHYYAYDTPNSNFGPSAPEDDVNNAVRELKYRLDPATNGRKGGDPALTVSTAEGLELWEPMTSAERLERTKYLADNPEAWKLVRVGIGMYIDEQVRAGNASIGTYSGTYQTMDMEDGDGTTPVIVDVTTSATFKYLEIGGHKFKLSCGYQPVKFVQNAPKAHKPPVNNPPSETPPGETPKCPNGSPVPPNGLCPKDPTEDVNVNPEVPTGVTGPGTTPVGGNPGPVVEPPDPEDPDGYTEENPPPVTPNPGPVEEGTVGGPPTGGADVGGSSSQADTVSTGSTSNVMSASANVATSG